VAARADTVPVVKTSPIEAVLARSADIASACEATCAAIAANGRLSACAYIARAGRLRAVADAGLAHVRDGVPVAMGAAGRALRSAAEQRDTGLDGAAIICVPIVAGGIVCGVLEVGAGSGLDPADEEEARQAAASLGARFESLGGIPPESASGRLAQHAAAIAGLEDPSRIERATLVAALDLAEMETAVLLRREDGGPPYASCAAGPLAHPLLALDDATLLALADAVAAGASWATTGQHGIRALPAPLAALRACGAYTTVAVPLSSRGEQLGALIVADSRELEPSTERVELLELVAAQAASCLRTSAAVAELRHRAATDPLTGLGHRGTFREILAATHRRPVAAGVALCDIDHFKDLNDSAGHQAGDRALQVVAQALQSALRRGDTLYRLGGDEFAALLAVRDENDALAAAQRMREAVAESDAGVTVSVGVAVSAASESDDSLVGRADRALYRAKGAGRNGVAIETASQSAAAS
jgi:diguanylate cyclase (GGDEF)-like protein